MHVVQRGNNRAPCFLSDSDRSFYLFHLRRLLGQSSCRLHAYCLMGNHVHLLFTPLTEASCAGLMRRLVQLHARYINRTHGRTGTLWEGRFKSALVQAETYLLNCYRYIELNPVRAGIVKHPRDYEWSSYRDNGEGMDTGLITPHEEYLRLGGEPDARRKAYRELFGSHNDEDRFRAIRDATKGDLVVGDRAFLARMAVALGRRVERGRAGRPTQDDRCAVTEPGNPTPSLISAD